MSFWTRTSSPDAIFPSGDKSRQVGMTSDPMTMWHLHNRVYLHVGHVVALCLWVSPHSFFVLTRTNKFWTQCGECVYYPAGWTSIFSDRWRYGGSVLLPPPKLQQISSNVEFSSGLWLSDINVRCQHALLVAVRSTRKTKSCHPDQYVGQLFHMASLHRRGWLKTIFLIGTVEILHIILITRQGWS